MAKTEKQRLDILLVEQGLAESREKAQALIMAGLVFTKDQKLTKSGHRIDTATPLTVKGKGHPYVSRGGVKLAGALDHFQNWMQAVLWRLMSGLALAVLQMFCYGVVLKKYMPLMLVMASWIGHCGMMIG
jgi:hypothetical protein